MLNKQPNIKHRGIAKRLVIAMILFSSLITLIVTAIQLYRDYQRDLSLIDSQLKQIQEIHQRSIASSLWLLDKNGMQLMVDGILQLPDILFVEVKDDEGVWASGGEVLTDKIIEREYALVNENSGQEIGVMTAVATLENVYQRLIDKAVDILVSNAIKTFLVAGFMLLFFHFLVTRHLIDIASFIRNQALGSDVEELQLNRNPSKAKNADELDLIVDELNLMQKSLYESYLTLKTSETKHRELFDTMAQGVIYRDQNGVIVSANDAAQEILGLSLEQMQGKEDINTTWRAIYEDGEPIADDALPSMTAMRSGEGIDNFVMGVFHPFEKRYRWILVSSKPWKRSIGDGDNLVFSTFTDITERKQADQEREKLIKELEIKNAELERFVYAISHELKTPLVTIAGFSGILKDDVEANRKEKLNDDVARITSAVGTMSVLLNELLELSQVGDKSQSREDVVLTDLANKVSELVKADPANQEIVIDVEQDLPRVFGNSRQLAEVLQILIENSIKFSSPERKPRIKIGTRKQGNADVIFVQDNGIGIEPEYRERVFTLFERLDPSVEGIGVGLAIVHRILEQHGGRVWVESEGKDCGSTFCFSVPGQELHRSAV